MRYDLVIFDIDGTLVDSGSVWAPAVLQAMREVYQEQKVPLSLPSTPELEAIIGIPGQQALHPFLPDEYRHLIPEISRRVGEYGPLAMRQGAGRLIVGVKETLEELRRRGSWIALASNCGNSYIQQVQETLGLRELVDLPLCLDSPGVREKSDMVSLAIESFGTRRALMVGDRFLDLEAAHRNGIPFVGFAGGFGEKKEWPQAEGTIHGYSEFFPLLDRRAALARSLAEEILKQPKAQTVGVSGLPSSGKSHFAEDLAMAFREKKAPLRFVSLDEFRRPLAEEGYDLDGLRRSLTPERPKEIVLVEGPLLLLEELGESLDRIVLLEVEEAIALRRFSGRIRRAADATAEQGFRRDFSAACGVYQAAKSASADRAAVVENSNLLEPRRLS